LIFKEKTPEKIPLLTYKLSNLKGKITKNDKYLSNAQVGDCKRNNRSMSLALAPIGDFFSSLNCEVVEKGGLSRGWFQRILAERDTKAVFTLT